MRRTSILLCGLAGLFWTFTTPSFAAKELPRILGPAKIELGDKIATIDMPSGYTFIKQDAAKALLKANGDSDEGVLGILAPVQKKGEEDDKNGFFVLCRFEDIGHVKDDDAGKLNADELLNSYKEGTKEQNEEKKQQGLPPLFIGGWAEKPHYDKAKHQVIWGIEVKDEESPTAKVSAVNYNTRILGRKGVLSMNLVTDPGTLEANKKKAQVLLDDTTFTSGNSYSDFKPGVDKDSGLGIAGLILGGGALAAAAKFGVLGGLWKFILAGVLVLKKFVILIIAALAAMFNKVFGKKKAGANANTSASADADSSAPTPAEDNSKN